MLFDRFIPIFKALAEKGSELFDIVFAERLHQLSVCDAGVFACGVVENKSTTMVRSVAATSEFVFPSSADRNLYGTNQLNHTSR